MYLVLQVPMLDWVLQAGQHHGIHLNFQNRLSQLFFCFCEETMTKPTYRRKNLLGLTVPENESMVRWGTWNETIRHDTGTMAGNFPSDPQT